MRRSSRRRAPARTDERDGDVRGGAAGAGVQDVRGHGGVGHDGSPSDAASATAPGAASGAASTRRVEPDAVDLAQFDPDDLAFRCPASLPIRSLSAASICVTGTAGGADQEDMAVRVLVGEVELEQLLALGGAGHAALLPRRRPGRPGSGRPIGGCPAIASREVVGGQRGHGGVARREQVVGRGVRPSGEPPRRPRPRWRTPRAAVRSAAVRTGGLVEPGKARRGALEVTELAKLQPPPRHVNSLLKTSGDEFARPAGRSGSPAWTGAVSPTPRPRRVLPVQVVVDGEAADAECRGDGLHAVPHRERAALLQDAYDVCLSLRSSSGSGLP